MARTQSGTRHQTRPPSRHPGLSELGDILRSQTVRHAPGRPGAPGQQGGTGPTGTAGRSATQQDIRDVVGERFADIDTRNQRAEAKRETEFKRASESLLTTQISGINALTSLLYGIDTNDAHRKGMAETVANIGEFASKLRGIYNDPELRALGGRGASGVKQFAEQNDPSDRMGDPIDNIPYVLNVGGSSMEDTPINRLKRGIHREIAREQESRNQSIEQAYAGTTTRKAAGKTIEKLKKAHTMMSDHVGSDGAEERVVLNDLTKRFESNYTSKNELKEAVQEATEYTLKRVQQLAKTQEVAHVAEIAKVREDLVHATAKIATSETRLAQFEHNVDGLRTQVENSPNEARKLFQDIIIATKAATRELNLDHQKLHAIVDQDRQNMIEYKQALDNQHIVTSAEHARALRLIDAVQAEQKELNVNADAASEQVKQITHLAGETGNRLNSLVEFVNGRFATADNELKYLFDGSNNLNNALTQKFNDLSVDMHGMLQYQQQALEEALPFQPFVEDQYVEDEYVPPPRSPIEISVLDKREIPDKREAIFNAPEAEINSVPAAGSRVRNNPESSENNPRALQENANAFRAIGSREVYQG